MTRTLLMDLDGTLVDTVPDLAPALNRLLRTRGLPAFTQAEVTSMVGDGIAALVSKAFTAYDRQPDPAAVDDMSADYTANVAVFSTLYPNVFSVLTSLSADGWCLAVCTNKPAQPARALLKALGILPLLSAVGGGDSFPVRKPDPRHLLATLTQASGTPEKALMLGDHRNDISAARAAGIPSIYAAWGYGSAGMEQGSTAQANNITEAAEMARRLLP